MGRLSHLAHPRLQRTPTHLPARTEKALPLPNSFSWLPGTTDSPARPDGFGSPLRRVTVNDMLWDLFIGRRYVGTVASPEAAAEWAAKPMCRVVPFSLTDEPPIVCTPE